MSCYVLRASLLSLLALSAIPVVAQNQSKIPQDPMQVERVAAPSPTATAQELEDIGDVLRMKKNFLDAMDYYTAAQKKGDSATLHNKVGICLIQLQRYPESKKEFEKAVHMDGNYPEAHNNLGAINYHMRRYGAAIKEYTRAIKLNDESAHFHSNLGSAYFSRKEFDKATREYERAMQLDPTIFDPQPGGGISVKLTTQGDRAYFHYMIAKMYGVKGDEEHCRLYLAKANEAGYPYIRNALKDGEFALMRKDPDFVAFVKTLKRPSDQME